MSYSSEVLADTPLIYWRLEEASGNFADSSGNGFTADAFGTLVYQQPPATGSGYSVTSSSDGRGGYTPGPINLTDPNIFTLEVWIKTSNDGSGTAEGMGVIERGVDAHHGL